MNYVGNLLQEGLQVATRKFYEVFGSVGVVEEGIVAMSFRISLPTWTDVTQGAASQFLTADGGYRLHSLARHLFPTVPIEFPLLTTDDDSDSDVEYDEDDDAQLLGILSIRTNGDIVFDPTMVAEILGDDPITLPIGYVRFPSTQFKTSRKFRVSKYFETEKGSDILSFFMDDSIVSFVGASLTLKASAALPPVKEESSLSEEEEPHWLHLGTVHPLMAPAMKSRFWMYCTNANQRRVSSQDAEINEDGQVHLMWSSNMSHVYLAFATYSTMEFDSSSNDGERSAVPV